MNSGQSSALRFSETFNPATRRDYPGIHRKRDQCEPIPVSLSMGPRILPEYLVIDFITGYGIQKFLYARLMI